MVCRLKKSLYELNQSSRAWFGQFASVVRVFGLSRSQKGHSVYWRQYQGKRLLLIVYVDDIIIISDDVHELIWNATYKRMFRHLESLR